MMKFIEPIFDISYLCFVIYLGTRLVKDKRKEARRFGLMAIYGLAAIRLGLLAFSQNKWGASGDYTFGLIRNIPFAIMGLLLIVWTYKYRHIHGLEKSSLWISLSFIFYLIVVAGAEFIPALGAFMMPKTLAYVFLILEGFRYFRPKKELAKSR